MLPRLIAQISQSSIAKIKRWISGGFCYPDTHGVGFQISLVLPPSAQQTSAVMSSIFQLRLYSRKAASQEAGGVPLVETVLANSHEELVVPGIITGTFEKPKFEPDMQRFAVMKLKGVVPTSDNPFGVLGTLFGHDNWKESKQPEQHRSKGVDNV